MKPEYASFDSLDKFNAIMSIIAKRLIEHPNAVCSYSGGSDSDTMLDLIERTRSIFNLPPIQYAFFNTGLELDATKRHVREQEKRYGITITEYRPKINIVQAVRKYGVPFYTKMFSSRLALWQRYKIPLSIIHAILSMDSDSAKSAIIGIKERYKCPDGLIRFLIPCSKDGRMINIDQSHLLSAPYMIDFLAIYPPDFAISSKCCDCCKKEIAHTVLSDYDMIITGERESEGGVRTISFSKYNSVGCFRETVDHKYRLRPLYYVSDTDKKWYKNHYGLCYSDAYEIYGLKRTGCSGCPINANVVQDLERIKQYEPNIVTASWNIFGDSYRYRIAYNEYKRKRQLQVKSRNTISYIQDGE